MTIELASKISGTVLVPGDEGYAAGIHRWATNAERNAAVVVQVTSASDVSAAFFMRNKRVWKLRSVVGNIQFQGLRQPKAV